MIAGYLLIEGMRAGTSLEGIPLMLTKIERYQVERPTAAQPNVWTTVEFAFREEDADRVAQALAAVLEEQGGWYTHFKIHDEIYVIFAGCVFRYRSGDQAGRAEAEAYGRAHGVPDRQLDWGE